MVDSTDRARFGDAKKELHAIVGDEDMRGVPLMVLANKQDCPGAARRDEIARVLELDKIGDGDWHVQECCALTGEGLCEGFGKLAAMMVDFIG